MKATLAARIFWFVIFLFTIGWFGMAPRVRAGEADVLAVQVRRTGSRTFTFSATLKHADEGWDHYADAWEVLGPEGKVLATRVLYHPHVEEQPFTRSLAGVEIPEGLKEVTVRAHDSGHGYGGRTQTVQLPGDD